MCSIVIFLLEVVKFPIPMSLYINIHACTHNNMFIALNISLTAKSQLCLMYNQSFQNVFNFSLLFAVARMRCTVLASECSKNTNGQAVVEGSGDRIYHIMMHKDETNVEISFYERRHEKIMYQKSEKSIMAFVMMLLQLAECCKL